MSRQKKRSTEPRGARIVVYTRFDSAGLDPENLSTVFGQTDVPPAEALAEPFRLEMFNHTGRDYTGAHYDPVFS